jgi:uncharacterized protein
VPVRSLTSSVLRWPDAATVDRALRQWAAKVVKDRDEVLQIGYFGSYARGDWGVGSDLDLVIVVERAAAPFERRSLAWDATELPVPADVLVYTGDEWQSLLEQSHFFQAVREEAVWVYARGQVE